MTEKKRKRGSGPFYCPFPGCFKSFSRSDHLGRHRANHSSQKFKCEWPACEREFSRLDVKKKHFARHLKNSNEGFDRTSFLYDNERNPNTDDKNDKLDLTIMQGSSSEQKMNGKKPRGSSILPPKSNGVGSVLENTDTTHTESNASSGPVTGNKKISPEELEENLAFTNDSAGEGGVVDNFSSTPTHSESLGLPTTLKNQKNCSTYIPQTNEAFQEVEGSNLPGFFKPPGMGSSSTFQGIQWLLGHSPKTTSATGRHSNHPENGAFHGHYESPLELSSLSVLEEIFSFSPEFPNAESQTSVDDEMLIEMAKCIPSVKNHPDFVAQKLEWFLEVYWLLYHSQYPILHRPSFSAHDTPPLLLISMIMMGASLSKRTIEAVHIQLVDPDGLSGMIAGPLRWLIFSSEQAKPPCKSWVIQSLIILETYEITSSSRCLHERACIYNGAKVQLLRRSPILGGDPLKEVGSDTSRSQNLWSTWIESESMKRVALMSFYIDSVHAIIFGHPLNLLANQIKLSLPCPDDLWEYNNIDRNKAPLSVAQTPLFCDAIKKLLQREEIEVGPFSMQILLAGLINLFLQIEQNLSQWSSFGWKSIQDSWRSTICSAIDFWKTQIPSKNCCSTFSSVYHLNCTSAVNRPLPPLLSSEDTRCSCPIYHAAQISTRMTHYDYIVFAGAPGRMNVAILDEDYEVVEQRIGKWAESQVGRLCVINSLILLCEVLLSPENSLEAVSYLYEPDKDPFLYRPNIVVSAVLSLWAYAYYVLGSESSFRSANSTFQIQEGCTPAMEDAPTYLSRIRGELKSLTDKPFYTLNQMDTSEYSDTITVYAQELPNVKNLNYMVGLLTSLRNGYNKCQWQVGREYAKLLDNCIQRSLGSENVFCQDMYDVK